MDKTKERIPLNNRLSITAELFVSLFMAIEENKSLVKGGEYCAKKICGKDFSMVNFLFKFAIGITCGSSAVKSLSQIFY